MTKSEKKLLIDVQLFLVFFVAWRLMTSGRKSREASAKPCKMAVNRRVHTVHRTFLIRVLLHQWTTTRSRKHNRCIETGWSNVWTCVDIFTALTSGCASGAFRRYLDWLVDSPQTVYSCCSLFFSNCASCKVSTWHGLILANTSLPVVLWRRMWCPKLSTLGQDLEKRQPSISHPRLVYSHS